MKKVNMDIANFNLTYGKDERPMLEHFSDLIYPAFKANISREKDDSFYSFYETKLGWAFTGVLVKDTTVDILSVVDEKTGEIIETDQSHPSAPYSFFCIFLKNHRMIFIPNQKESPLLRSFSTTANYVIKEYRKRENRKRKEKNYPILPTFELDVIGIASKERIIDELQKVEKIGSLKLRFFPLNGEDFEEVSSATSSLLKQITQLKKLLKSRTANTVINSPQDKENVATVVEEVEGIAEPTLEVTYYGGQKGKIKNEKIAQKREITISGNQIIDEKQKAIEEAEANETLQKVSLTNSNIYNKFINSIIDKLSK